MTNENTAQPKSTRPRRFARESAGSPETNTETPTTGGSEGEVAAPPRVTKTEQVITLLRREQGATLEELIAATGWLPHTTRAALTGLRKKGHTIEKSKRDEATCYRITASA